MVNIEDARYCLELLRKKGHDQDNKYKIGKIKHSFEGIITKYKEGEIVLFTKLNNCEVFVEIPYDIKTIDEIIKNRGFGITYGGILNVPINWLEEIVEETK